MHDVPTISILIATYNRVKFLETAVSLFISQIISGGLAGHTEIIIGNNASSDGTREYLDGLRSKHDFVKVINHSENFGLSGNLESLITAANGEYVWLFSDDDLIVDGAVARVLKFINLNAPNYIIINTKNILSLDDRNLNYEIASEGRLAISKDVFIKNFDEERYKLSEIGNWLYLTNLISAVAFKKRLFFDWIGEAKKRVRADSVYLFQAPLIMGMSKHGNLGMIADPLVLHRKNENNWSKSISGILGVNLYDSSEIVGILREYMPSERARYQKRFAANVFSILLSAKKSGKAVNKYIIDSIRLNYGCYPYNIRFLAILLIPGFMLKRFF